MSGKGIWDLGSGISDFLAGAIRSSVKVLSHRQIRNPQSAIRNAWGFSLLELMIAMFVLIILLSVAFPIYQRTVLHAKETVLKENLWQMRRAIDSYTADKGKLPKTLEELVEGQYLREVPVDPILEENDKWDIVQGEDKLTPDGEQGMRDVKSTAPGQDSDGKPYRDY